MPKCPACTTDYLFRSEDSEVCPEGEMYCPACGFTCCSKYFTRISRAVQLADTITEFVLGESKNGNS